MKTKLAMSVMCGLAALTVGLGVQAAEKSFDIGGDLELDLTATDGDDRDTSFGHGGRVKLNFTGEMKGDNGYFVKGVAQPLVPFNEGGSNEIGYDDVFLQFGSSAWDVQLGRFEGINLFPLGKDTVVEHANGAGVYEANKVRGRRDDVLHGALNVGAGATQFQLGAMASDDGSNSVTGVRPAIVYDMGNVSFHAGLDVLDDEETDTTYEGVGLGVGIGMGGGNLNASIAQGTTEVGSNETDTTSAAVNYTNGPWGVGYIHSTEDASGGDDPTLNTLYGAYTVPLMGLKDASTTFAFSTSTGEDSAGNDDNVNAVRARFNYAF